MHWTLRVARTWLPTWPSFGPGGRAWTSLRRETRRSSWTWLSGDAAILAREEAAQGGAPKRTVDVGSGGGAPGIPLAIFLVALRGKCDLTLVEPRSKRVTFLRTVSAQLTSVRIDVVRGRSEDLADASFDVAVSRATLPPDAWLTEGGRLAREAVWVLLARGEAPAAPVWSVQREVDYEWPLVGHKRRALRYAKT